MERPKRDREDSSTFLVTVPKELAEAIHIEAQREKRSRNRQIEYILENWLRRSDAGTGNSTLSAPAMDRV